jgi:hypothetical protein
MYSIQATLMILGMVSSKIQALSGNGCAVPIFVESEWSIDFNHPRGIFIRDKFRIYRDCAT